MLNQATEAGDTKAQAVAALYQLQNVTIDRRVRLRNFLLSLADCWRSH